MQKLFIIFIASIMLLCTACTAPKTNETGHGEAAAETEAAVTAEPAETEAPAAEHEFKAGGIDFCEKLELGNTYCYDLDGDEKCDTVYFNNDIADAPYWGRPYVIVTFGRLPDYPAVRIMPQERSTVWAVDCDPDDGRMELVERDDGDSDDPESIFFFPDYDKSGFNEMSAPGVWIDSEHPFSTENGFYVEFWSDLMGTQLLNGHKRLVWDKLEPVGLYSMEGRKHTLKAELAVTRLNEDGSLGEAISLVAGDTVTDFETDNRTFIIFKLEDGSLIRAEIEFTGYGESEPGEMVGPWSFNGIKQDELFTNVSYSG